MTMDGGFVDEVAEHPPQRMEGIEGIVTVGHDHQSAGAGDPPADESEQIERCLIGPMCVFSDEHVRSGRIPQGGEHGAEDTVAGSLRVEHGFDLWPEGLGDVEQGSERAGHLETVAGDDRERRALANRLGEPLDQGSLSTTGFAAQEHEPASAGGGFPQVLVELGELRFALQKFHGRNLAGGYWCAHLDSYSRTRPPRP